MITIGCSFYCESCRVALSFALVIALRLVTAEKLNNSINSLRTITTVDACLRTEGLLVLASFTLVYLLNGQAEYAVHVVKKYLVGKSNAIWDGITQ